MQQLLHFLNADHGFLHSRFSLDTILTSVLKYFISTEDEICRLQ